MERNGYPEETYYTFSYSPIPDDDGSAGGIICANTDDTQRVIGERQLALLRELAARTAEARTWQRGVRSCRPALAHQPARPALRHALHGRAGQHARVAGGSHRHRARPPGGAGLDGADSTTSRLAGRARCCATQAPMRGRRFAARLRRRTADRRLGQPPDQRRRAADRRDRRDRPRRRADRRPQPVPPVRRQLSRLPRARRRPDRGGDRQRARPTRRSAAAPRRWPRSTARRPRSSPTSATSSARR